MGKGTEAFEWLDRYFTAAMSNQDFGSDDEAADWIFMTHEEDFQALRNAWPSRSDDWKLMCAFTLGIGPAKGQTILKEALADSNPEVVIEAAVGLARLTLSDMEEEDNEVELDDEILKHLENIANDASFYHEEKWEIEKILKSYHR